MATSLGGQMTEGTQLTLLRRMTRAGAQATTDDPVTFSRALRLAFAKVADEAVGLSVTVASVADAINPLDDVLAALDDDILLVRLIRDDACVGVIGLDRELCAAVVEMQTMGGVLAQIAPQRAPTGTDRALCDPLLHAFLLACPAAVVGTPLAGWADGISTGDRFENLRAAGLGLNDGSYRTVTLSIDLGISDRQGALLLALPPHETAASEDATPAIIDWGSILRENVEEAPAAIDVLLHRFSISLEMSQSLKVGSVLPLTGCSTSSAKLIAPDGRMIGQAKLGQVNGFRAVRLEAPALPHLTDLPDQAPPSVVALDGPAGPNDTNKRNAKENGPTSGGSGAKNQTAPTTPEQG